MADPASNISYVDHYKGGAMILPLFEASESQWNRYGRAVAYLIGLCYMFLGVNIIADVFMASIEVITSKTKKIKIATANANGDNGDDSPNSAPHFDTIEVKIWNDTVSNLTLMALGSSAPEILLSIIEIVGNNFEPGELGPGTIVGSASFNLLVITAICIYVIPDDESRRIKEINVFACTSFFAVFAYIWLYLVIEVITPGVIEIWEGIVTFLFFPLIVLLAFAADKNFWRKQMEMEGDWNQMQDVFSKQKTGSEEDVRHIIEMGKKQLKDPKEAADIATAEMLRRTHHSRAWYRVIAGRANKGGSKVPFYNKPKVREAMLMPMLMMVPDEDQAALEGKEPSRNGDMTVARVEFSAAAYSCMENEGTIKLGVVRTGNLACKTSVNFETSDGTANAGEDYVAKAGVIEFEEGECIKCIEIEIIDDDVWEETETFFVRLFNPSRGTEMDKICVTQVSIINDDEPGILQFQKPSYLYKESAGMAELVIERNDGCDGRVTVRFKTKDITAIAGKDYEARDEEVEFTHGEVTKTIQIPLHDDDVFNEDKIFEVMLSDPTAGSTLGKIKCTIVTILNDDDYQTLITRVANLTSVNLDKLVIGKESWKQQFTEALSVNGGNVDEAEALDFVLHFLTFGWKVLFACVPPAHIAGGWLCFCVSLGVIAIVTAIIGDMASILGLLLGIKDSVTAITLVALGTSLPDTFASKVAATNEDTADAAIGNITGSNSVNVFLGLGIPWVIATLYKHYSYASNDKRSKFIVEDKSLPFTIALYSIAAISTLLLLTWRRYSTQAGKAELGGNPFVKKVSAGFCVSFWLIYIVCASLYAYQIIDFS
ncbi:hypothetical protein ACHWQZ_G014602 [Mnemiopsis leidyi]